MASVHLPLELVTSSVKTAYCTLIHFSHVLSSVNVASFALHSTGLSHPSLMLSLCTPSHAFITSCDDLLEFTV